jgi:hypothetical protein
MTRKTKRWIILNVIRPPLVLVRVIVSATYNVLFGWVKKRVRNHSEKELERDIRDALPFLFESYQAIVEPPRIDLPSRYYYLSVTVRIDRMRIRFSRGRGELDVKVGPIDNPAEWYELAFIVSVLQESERSGCRIKDLWHASRLLEQNIASIQSVFGSPEGPLRNRLAQAVVDERIVIREAEWEINKRLRR